MGIVFPNINDLIMKTQVSLAVMALLGVKARIINPAGLHWNEDPNSRPTPLRDDNQMSST